MASKGRMRFQTMPCTSCGAKRIVGVPCDDCGAPALPGEVNAHVVRRRSAILRVDELVAAHQPEPGELPNPDEVWRAVRKYTVAVTQFAEDPTTSSVDDLAHAVCALDDLKWRSQHAPKYRPRIAMRSAILTSTERLVVTWPLYRDTLTASSMREVQRLSGEAQQALENATEELNCYTERAAAFDALDGGPTSTLLERTMRVLTGLHKGTLVYIAGVGSEAAKKLTGHNVSPGAGVQFLVQDAVASAWLDHDRFEETISEASEFCRLADFTPALASGSALHGIAASQRRLAEAALAFEAILATADDEETLFRRLLLYHAEIYEQVGGPLFAWYLLLSGTKSKPYEKLLGEGVNALAKTIDNVPNLSRWFEGREPFLRNAASHVGGFHVTDGIVHITLGSVQALHPVEWVVDRIYAFLESMLVTSWALFNELERRDIDVPISEADQRYLGITSFAMAELFAATSLNALDSQDNDGVWHFDLPPGDDDALTTALALIGHDPAVRSVSVVRTGAGAQLTVPLEAWERCAEVTSAGPIEAQVVSMVEFRAQCALGGAPILSEADLRSAVAPLGLTLLAGDISLVKYLRQLDRIAVDHQFIDAHDRIIRALKTLRTDDVRERERLRGDFGVWIQEPLELPRAHSAQVYRKLHAP